MNERVKGALLGALAVIVLGAVVVGVALSVSGDDDDGDDETVVVRTETTEDDPVDVAGADERPMEPAELRRVAAAAERIVGGGRVTDVERSDDPGEAYEIEVWTDRGEVDIALDESLERVPNNPYED